MNATNFDYESFGIRQRFGSAAADVFDLSDNFGLGLVKLRVERLCNLVDFLHDRIELRLDLGLQVGPEPCPECLGSVRRGELQ